ncbi:hypothetical protein HYZ99_03800 [Candidatus Peregrinibacteria bacterium]|nr:hypothetical protein [Candidatus Peregrinibacteria bacterium]
MKNEFVKDTEKGAHLYALGGYLVTMDEQPYMELVAWSPAIMLQFAETLRRVLDCVGKYPPQGVTTHHGIAQWLKSIAAHQETTGERLARERSPLLPELFRYVGLETPDVITDAHIQEFRTAYGEVFASAVEELHIFGFLRNIRF